MSQSNKFSNNSNLSKSIIIHHNKHQNLLNTMGRYNDDLYIQDLDDDDHINNKSGNEEIKFGYLIDNDLIEEDQQKMTVNSVANGIKN